MILILTMLLLIMQEQLLLCCMITWLHTVVLCPAATFWDKRFGSDRVCEDAVQSVRHTI